MTFPNENRVLLPSFVRSLDQSFIRAITAAEKPCATSPLVEIFRCRIQGTPEILHSTLPTNQILFPVPITIFAWTVNNMTSFVALTAWSENQHSTYSRKTIRVVRALHKRLNDQSSRQ